MGEIPGHSVKRYNQSKLSEHSILIFQKSIFRQATSNKLLTPGSKCAYLRTAASYSVLLLESFHNQIMGPFPPRSDTTLSPTSGTSSSLDGLAESGQANQFETIGDVTKRLKDCHIALVEDRTREQNRCRQSLTWTRAPIINGEGT